jgi:hypothetical protein
VIVEAGYDRTINPGVPTPARLIPPIDPAKLTSDLIHPVAKPSATATAHGLPPRLGKVARTASAAPAHSGHPRPKSLGRPSVHS